MHLIYNIYTIYKDKSTPNFLNIIHKFLPCIFFIKLNPINPIISSFPKITNHT